MLKDAALLIGWNRRGGLHGALENAVAASKAVFSSGCFDKASDLVEHRRVLAGHGLHRRHTSRHEGRNPFFDRAFGVGEIDHCSLAIAVTAALDLS